MKTLNLTFVIEDDEITSFLIKKIIGKNNAFKEILSFENGQPALNRLIECVSSQRTLPDLILLDINMPIMDGWDFLDGIKELGLPQPIPVVMLTSSINDADKKKAWTYENVKGYFSKPLNEAKVEELLKILH